MPGSGSSLIPLPAIAGTPSASLIVASLPPRSPHSLKGGLTPKAIPNRPTGYKESFDGGIQGGVSMLAAKMNKKGPFLLCHSESAVACRSVSPLGLGVPDRVRSRGHSGHSSVTKAFLRTVTSYCKCL